MRRATFEALPTGEVPVLVVEQVDVQPVVSSGLWRGVGYALAFEAVAALTVTFFVLLGQAVVR